MTSQQGHGSQRRSGRGHSWSLEAVVVWDFCVVMITCIVCELASRGPPWCERIPPRATTPVSCVLQSLQKGWKRELTSTPPIIIFAPKVRYSRSKVKPFMNHSTPLMAVLGHHVYLVGWPWQGQHAIAD